jgi:uncharacterized protein YhhL (DUF1145 family)
MRIPANIVFFGFVCWALVDQYPHPEEDGVLTFTVLIVLTPILSLVVLFGGRKRKMQEQQRTIARPQ